MLSYANQDRGASVGRSRSIQDAGMIANHPPGNRANLVETVGGSPWHRRTHTRAGSTQKTWKTDHENKPPGPAANRLRAAIAHRPGLRVSGTHRRQQLAAQHRSARHFRDWVCPLRPEISAMDICARPAKRRSSSEARRSKSTGFRQPIVDADAQSLICAAKWFIGRDAIVVLRPRALVAKWPWTDSSDGRGLV